MWGQNYEHLMGSHSLTAQTFRSPLAIRSSARLTFSQNKTWISLCPICAPGFSEHANNERQPPTACQTRMRQAHLVFFEAL